uniref:Uncharacterized protein n=1 Tax=Arundo donax TaxID=35708 RepID=A0A0A8ZKE3_ARUDO
MRNSVMSPQNSMNSSIKSGIPCHEEIKPY